MSKMTVDYEYIITQTPKAICFRIKGKTVWLPKSQIETDTDLKMVQMTERMYNEKIEYAR